MDRPMEICRDMAAREKLTVRIAVTISFSFSHLLEFSSHLTRHTNNMPPTSTSYRYHLLVGWLGGDVRAGNLMQPATKCR